MKSLNSKKRRERRARIYYLQEGRCAECRRSCTLEDVSLTRTDRSNMSYALTNLRVLCGLCMAFVRDEGLRRARKRRQGAEEGES